MSSSGDIGGEVSGEEAAWRDLIARFDAPAYADVDRPWPSRENLPDAVQPGADEAAAADPAVAAGPAAGAESATEPGPPAGSGTDPATGAVTDPAAAADPAVSADQVPGAGQPGQTATGVFVPADRTRVIRYAGDPRSYSPPEEEDEAYVPVPLPPPAKLDTFAKAAWAGLIGGPLYLLLGTFLHWTISGIEAFAAVAAFVGGFVTLVIRLGDRERGDDDDGAVL